MSALKEWPIICYKKYAKKSGVFTKLTSAEIPETDSIDRLEKTGLDEYRNRRYPEAL